MLSAYNKFDSGLSGYNVLYGLSFRFKPFVRFIIWSTDVNSKSGRWHLISELFFDGKSHEASELIYICQIIHINKLDVV